MSKSEKENNFRCIFFGKKAVYDIFYKALGNFIIFKLILSIFVQCILRIFKWYKHMSKWEYLNCYF